MVAYSFKKRFAAPILAGTKAQTIRADRKRHARPGEFVQLFTGMRTKHCRKLGAAPCISVDSIRLWFTRGRTRETLDAVYWASHVFEIGNGFLSPAAMEQFAQADGFTSVADMARFWFEAHPPENGDLIEFAGVLIRWQPLAPADPLDIGAVT